MSLGDKIENKDSCSGDSGGPLFIRDLVDDNEKYVLAGVVSYGPLVCGSSYPA